VASELAAAVLYIIALLEHERVATITFYGFLSISVLLFWFGGYLAWDKKRNELEKFISQKPKIKVQIDKLKWRPRQLGIGPYPEPDGMSTYDVFVHAHLELEEPASVQVVCYRLYRTSSYETSSPAENLNDLHDWELVLDNHNTGRDTILSLNPLPKELTQRGELIHGWVHFHVGRCMEANMNSYGYTLEIVCEHGSNQGVRRAGFQYPELSLRRKVH